MSFNISSINIVCPICRKVIEIDMLSAVCELGHRFAVRDGIIDLMPTRTDRTILVEEQHWDRVAEQGGMSVRMSEFFDDKLFHDSRKTIEKWIRKEWPDLSTKDVSIADIGCGTGSAIVYLGRLEFARVEYVGIDVSMKIMKFGVKKLLPSNYKKAQFVRTSANSNIFNDESLEIVFCKSSLHHLDISAVIGWVSDSLKPGGLFIIYEPSHRNPFANMGRRVVQNLHTEHERPISPSSVKEIAKKYDLHLIEEKGLHFLRGPLGYLIGIAKMPKAVASFAYYFAGLVDFFVTSSAWNYSFAHMYRK